MCYHIIIKEKGQNVPVRLKSVLRFEAHGNYVNIYLKNGKTFKDQVGNLGLWEERIKSFGKFVKLNRSNLVHYKRIVSFSRACGVLLRLCSKKQYAEITSMKDGAEKTETLGKNLIHFALSPDGCIELMWRFMDNGSGGQQVNEEQ